MAANELEFEAVYRSFHERIHRYLERFSGQTEVDDLVQVVFLRVSSSLADFRGDSALSTWIYRIATNVAIDRSRRADAHDVEASLDDENQPNWSLLDEQPLPDEQVMRREMYDCFGEYVKDLPAAYRAVVILSDLEDLPNREIAEILGLSLDTVKIRLHRGRAMLFHQLRQNCKAEDWL